MIDERRLVELALRLVSTPSFTGSEQAAAELIDAVRRTKQFLTYTSSGALQHGVAAGLALGDAPIAEIRSGLVAQRDLLIDVLTDAGFEAPVPEAGYFVVADAAWTGATNGMEFCQRLPEAVGVGAIPLSSFYLQPERAGALVRFAFCKRPDLIAEAGRRLAGLTRP